VVVVFLEFNKFFFFAEKYPKRFSHIANINSARGERYPFAIASFNVTMMLFEILGWGWKNPGESTANQTTYYAVVKLLFPHPDNNECTETIFTLNEMYCLAVIILDQKWDEISASYMDFPVVIKNTQTTLEQYFSDGRIKNLEDLLSLLKDK